MTHLIFRLSIATFLVAGLCPPAKAQRNSRPAKATPPIAATEAALSDQLPSAATPETQYGPFLAEELVKARTPRLKFGMEVIEHPLGLCIDELVSDRPVANELQEGDILVSYAVVTEERSGIHPLRRESDLEGVVKAVADGLLVEITLLRPEQNVGPVRYTRIPILVNAGKLTRPVKLKFGRDNARSAAEWWPYTKESVAGSISVESAALDPTDKPIGSFTISELKEQLLINQEHMFPIESMKEMTIAGFERQPSKNSRLTSGNLPKPGVTRAPQPNIAAKVGVLYATDRQHDRSGNYNGDRDLTPQAVKYGICEVSIPPNSKRKVGTLPGPSVFRFYREDVNQHVLLTDLVELKKEEMHAILGAALKGFPEPAKRRALVFVHGFNVSFEDAARRTAQLHYDLNFPGIPLFFSWPSKAAFLRYPADEATIITSTPHIRDFLNDLNERTDIDEIYLIAHSMGNRGITQALIDMKAKGGGKKIKEVILAAPDIDVGVFETQIAPALTGYYPRATIYASSNDLALRASMWFSSYRRVGQIYNGEPTIKLPKGFEVVDASAVGTDYTGHIYYGDAKSVITDFYQVITSVNHPRLFLQPIKGKDAEFWRLRD